MKYRNLLSIIALTCLPVLASGVERASWQSSEVTPASSIAPPCVSIRMYETSVVSIPRSILERFVADAPQGRWTTEPERLARIVGNRASALLQQAEEPVDRFGCQTTSLADIPGDSAHLIAQLVEDGLAAVSSTDQPGLASTVRVSILNPDCSRGPMGNKSMGLPGGPPIILLTLCVSHPPAWNPPQ